MKNCFLFSLLFISMSAFAQKSMITLEGFETGDQSDRSVNFSDSHGGPTNDKYTDIAFNYAYAITDFIQLGLSFRTHKETSGGDVAAAGDKYSAYGVKAIYNFAGKLVDTNYMSLEYVKGSFSKSDFVYDTDGDNVGDSKLNDKFSVDSFHVQFGHRFSLGNIWNLNFNYSPAVELTFTKISFADSDLADIGDGSNTSVQVVPVKFDVIF